MHSLINQLKSEFKSTTPTYNELGKLVRSLELDQLDYKKHLPDLPENGDYGRNIMLLDPLECVLLFWPPKCESAIHYHAGFWGYVMVAEGCCDNVEFKLEKGQLIETRTLRGLPGGILNEPDGTIHKICNPSETENLVTIHFYYPALDNLNNLAIYGENGTLGVLNEHAKAASFKEPQEHFKKLEHNAFEYIPFINTKNAKSHHILPVIPKPNCEIINNMIGSYYSEQAQHYDLFDFNHPTRKKYTKKINALIHSAIDKEKKIDSLLALACGTGRRAMNIKKDSLHNYHVVGVDLSSEMCKIAEERGIETITGSWLDVDLGERKFDACTFLYAFGHITTSEDRLKAIRKISTHLNPGGLLFFDVFNLFDKYEWGKNALKTYQDMNLNEWGYEEGDVFYKKTDGNEVAFLHYFKETEITSLLEDAGFVIDEILHVGYVHRSGEILDKQDEGSLFITARKL